MSEVEKAKAVLKLYEEFKKGYLELQDELAKIDETIEGLHEDYDRILKELKSWNSILASQNKLLGDSKLTKKQKDEIFAYIDNTVTPNTEKLGEQAESTEKYLRYAVERFNKVKSLLEKFEETGFA